MILFEVRLRKASLRRLIGAVTGSILGILGAYLTSLIFTHTTMPESTRSFFSLAVFLVMTYIGLVLGASKGDMLNLQAFGGVFGSEKQHEALRSSARYQRDHRWPRGGHRGCRCFSTAPSSFRSLFCASCSSWPIQPIR